MLTTLDCDGEIQLEQRGAESHSRSDRLSILRWYFLCPLLFLFAVRSVWAVDPTRHISQYAHSAWRTQDGVFGGTPRRITQTTDGYVWLGTTSGLWRFDGVHFVFWIPPEGQKLPSSRINSLLGTPDGSLWIGTAVGLSLWKDNHLTNYLADQGVVTSIIQTENGAVWIQLSDPTGKTGPLCQIIRTGMQCHGKDDGIPAGIYTPLVEDRQGNLWLGSDTALVGWKSDWHRTYKPSGLNSSAGSGGIEALAADPDGSLWVGMARTGAGLQHLTQGVLERFRTPRFDGSTLEVESLLLDRERALWVGTTKHGIYRVYEGEVEHFGSADGLSSDYVFQYFEDREGNLWVLTPKGIDSFHDVKVASFSTKEGLGTGEVNSVLASRNGSIWIAGGEALDLILHDRVSSITHAKGLPGELVTSLFEDHVGRLWVGIDQGLTVYENGRFRQINRPDGSTTGLIVGIAEDVDHNIWVEASKSPDRTLIRIQDFVVREEFPAQLMPAARRVAADPEGGIWLGLMNGDLARYQHGRIETFHFQHAPESRVEQVTVNPDGSVMGATPSGLIGLRHGKQLTLTTRNGLPCNNVYSFISDRRGDLWLYTECALVKITNSDLEKWWQDPDTVVRPRVFDALDGVQPNRPPFEGAAKSLDGRLWFANSNLLQMIDPDHLDENPLTPPVHVESVIADRKNYSADQDLRLPPITRELEIDYTALSFVVPQKVLFRYKLEGHDAAWQEPGTRREAFYNDLRPGSYRFRVIACNNDGVWNEEGAVLDFSIAAAWYQTKLFYFLDVITGALIIWAFYRFRVHQISMTMSTRFDERLAERTRLARELHDTLLQTVQASKLIADGAMIHATDTAHMHSAIQRLSKFLGQAVVEGRAALNSLRGSTTRRNDLVEALLRVTENSFVPNSMQVAFVVNGEPRAMHPIVRDEVYRIGYEAIRNACVHSDCTRLEIEISYTQDLGLRVADNGIGIDPAIAENGKVGHFGLPGMRERAARIRGKLIIFGAPTSGTEIRLWVPGRVLFQKATPRNKVVAKIVAIFRPNRTSELD
jgi:ligand-binding sensor domain-containing protein/signal transduction histidine kinase